MCLSTNERVRRVSGITQGVSPLRTHSGNLSSDGSDSNCSDRRLIAVRTNAKRQTGDGRTEGRREGNPVAGAERKGQAEVGVENTVRAHREALSQTLRG